MQNLIKEDASIRQKDRNAGATVEHRQATEKASIDFKAQQTLIDSISASSLMPFFSYPGGGYGKHRDIFFL
uniref:Uncharacterized protein n=1 Tax=Rhizophora mucronata TaxID=61149 RepID=A0A2P2JLN2_RHIMU